MEQLAGSPIFAIGLAGGFLIFVVIWVRIITRQFRPWVQRTLAKRWGVTIVESIGFETSSWEIKGKHTMQQGCMLSIFRFVVDIGCLAAPIFIMLGLIGILLFGLSGG